MLKAKGSRPPPTHTHKEEGGGGGSASFPQRLSPGRQMLVEPSTKPYLSHGRWKGKTRQGEGKTKRKSKRKASMAKKRYTDIQHTKRMGGGKLPKKENRVLSSPFILFVCLGQSIIALCVVLSCTVGNHRAVSFAYLSSA